MRGRGGVRGWSGVELGGEVRGRGKVRREVE